MHPMPTIRPMSTGLKVFSIPITTTAAESAPYRPTGKQAITTLWLPIRPSLYMLCDQTDLAPVFVHQAHRELLKESSRPKLPSPFSSSLLLHRTSNCRELRAPVPTCTDRSKHNYGTNAPTRSPYAAISSSTFSLPNSSVMSSRSALTSASLVVAFCSAQ